MSILVLLVVCAALIVLAGHAARQVGAAGGDLRAPVFRRPPPTRASEVQMIEVIRNRKFLPVPWVKAESRISPNLRFLSDADTKISGERYHKSVFSLKPFHQITRTHRVPLLKRGYYRAGSVSVQAGDLFGLHTPRMQVDTGAAIEVLPRLLSPDEIPLPSTRWQGDLLVKRWIVPDPVWVNGVRPYPGGRRAQGYPLARHGARGRFAGEGAREDRRPQDADRDQRADERKPVGRPDGVRAAGGGVHDLAHRDAVPDRASERRGGGLCRQRAAGRGGRTRCAAPREILRARRGDRSPRLRT